MFVFRFCRTTNSDDTGRQDIQGSQVMHAGNIQCFEHCLLAVSGDEIELPSVIRLCSIPYLTALSLSDRKPLWNSRVVTQTDDVHLCIMCLRAIMNYQVWQRDSTSHGLARTHMTQCVTKPISAQFFSPYLGHCFILKEL